MTNAEFAKKYNCPNLRERNLTTAKLIASDLKAEKCISNEAFIQKMIKYRRSHTLDRHYKNFETIIAFLRWHNIVTKENINGLVVWVATQKCVRSKPENLFIVKQEVLKRDITTALEYQKLNGGLVNFDVEGRVIAERILKLKGQTCVEFITAYNKIMFMHTINGKDNLYEAIIGPVYGIKTIKVIQK